MTRWQIGDVRISKFVEKEFAGSVHRFLLLEATPEASKDIAWLKPHFMTENGKRTEIYKAAVMSHSGQRFAPSQPWVEMSKTMPLGSRNLCSAFARTCAEGP